MKLFFSFILSLTLATGIVQAEQISTSSVVSQNVELPLGVLDFNDLIETFRATFRRKIEELSETFIVRQTGDINSGAFSYLVSKSANCYGPSYSAGEEISKLVYQQEIKDIAGSVEKELHEKVQYWGCFKSVELTESTYLRGKNLQLRKPNDIRKAKRDFNLNDDVSELYWRMHNQDSVEIVSVQIFNKPNQEIRAYFKVTGNLVATMSYQYSSNENRYIFQMPDVDISYIRRYARWTSRYSSSSPHVYEVRQTPTRGTTYLNQNRERISQRDFQEVMINVLIGNYARLKIVDEFFKYHNYGFPQTAVAVNLGNNQKILNELRLANIRLLGGTDLNLVQNLIQNYIEAIEKGHIQVDDLRETSR